MADHLLQKTERNKSDRGSEPEPCALKLGTIVLWTEPLVSPTFVLQIVEEVLCRDGYDIACMDKREVMEGVRFLEDWACGNEAVPPLLGNDLVVFDIFEQSDAFDDNDEVDDGCIDRCLL